MKRFILFILLWLTVGGIVCSCYTLGPNDPDARKIHEQFPEHSGGWLLTNNTERCK